MQIPNFSSEIKYGSLFSYRPKFFTVSSFRNLVLGEDDGEGAKTQTTSMVHQMCSAWCVCPHFALSKEARWAAQNWFQKLWITYLKASMCYGASHELDIAALWALWSQYRRLLRQNHRACEKVPMVSLEAIIMCVTVSLFCSWRDGLS